MANFNSPLTVDVVIFSIVKEELCVLMTKRESEPFSGLWALPKGDVKQQDDMSLEQSAKRNIKALLNIETPYVEQVQTIGNNSLKVLFILFVFYIN